MPISVGINENVMLAKVAIGEKGALELYLDEAKEKANIFDSLNTAKVENTGTEVRLLVFPVKKPEGVRAEGKTDDELLDTVNEDLLKLRNQLTQILEQYLTSDKISWDIYAGTGVDGANYRTMFLNDEALRKISENYFTQFVDMVRPFVGNPAYKLRWKLIRQSKDKHFATLPGKYLVDSPMVELMDVPAEASKVKFTKWEIDNGLNDGTPVAKPKKDGEEPAEGENAFTFGQR